MKHAAIHPHTNQPLTPIGFRRPRPGETGPQPIMPILGAAEGDGGGGDAGGSGGGASGAAGGSGGDELGFPKDTPVKDMTGEQREKYWEHQAKKHEDRNKEWRNALGGKLPADLKADLDDLEALRAAGRTDHEKAVEEAKTAAKAETRAEYGAKLVAAEFRGALAHLVTVDDQGVRDTKRRDAIIDGLNLTTYLNDNGDVDTDKVTSYAAAIAPTDKGSGGRQDVGGGRHSGTNGGGSRKGSVGALIEERRERREKRSTRNT